MLARDPLKSVFVRSPPLRHHHRVAAGNARRAFRSLCNNRILQREASSSLLSHNLHLHGGSESVLAMPSAVPDQSDQSDPTVWREICGPQFFSALVFTCRIPSQLRCIETGACNHGASLVSCIEELLLFLSSSSTSPSSPLLPIRLTHIGKSMTLY